MTEDTDAITESNFLRRAILDDMAQDRLTTAETRAESRKLAEAELAVLARIADLLERIVEG